MSRIGWYVHHHGNGHLMRFLAVAPHLHADVTVFSSLPPPASLPSRTAWVTLPRDDDPFADGGDPSGADPSVRGLLHWAPLGHDGHRRRLGMIAAVCAEGEIEAFVVDVSVEVTLWVRLLGIPTVVVAQPGERTDLAHQLAYRAADRILAPWAAGMIFSAALENARDRVVWVGGISRFDGRRPADGVGASGEAGRPGERSAVVLGPALARDAVAALRARGTGAGWAVSAMGTDPSSWRADPWPLLTEADVVISAAGQNSVADIAAAGARAVVIAQDRPFAEQAATARALRTMRLAVAPEHCSTAGTDLLPLLDEAYALRPDWTKWQVAGAAGRAVAVIESVIG